MLLLLLLLLCPSAHIRDMISFRYIGHAVQRSAGFPGLPPFVFEAETPATQMCPLCHLHDAPAPAFTLSLTKRGRAPMER